MRRLISLVVVVLALPAAARAEGVLQAVGPNGEARGTFPLTRTDVQGEVSGQVVSVRVDQTFRNTFSERIEAVYVFPLPAGAAVDEMEMKIGTRVVRAVVRPRGEAREIYDRARQTGRRAALLEQERPNIFTFSVANIDPGGEIQVRLHYFDLARYDDGTYSLAFPMTVGPRYNPGSPLPGRTGTGTHPDTDRVDDASRISPAYVAPGTRSGHTIGLSMKVDGGAPLDAIEAPAHDIELVRPGPNLAVVTLHDKEEIPNRDFVLRWKLEAPRLQAAVFTHRPDASTDGYVALLLEPRHEAPISEIAPRELFFLLDTSGSMSGTPLQTAVAAIKRAIEALHPNDTFQIIDFADRASSFARRPLPNRPENVRAALEYLGSLRSSGGTNQLAGIHAALSAPGDVERVRYVVFLTDGYIGNEGEVLGLVNRELGRAHIFGIGIGSSVNRYLLDEVSAVGRGAVEYLRPREDATAVVERFYRRIGRPYLTGIEIDWGGLPVDRVVPTRIPDLSALEPLVVWARYRGPASGTVTVRGRLAGRAASFPVAVQLPATRPDNAAISRLWARNTITHLTRESHFSGESAQVIDRVMNLALEHSLVTQYTSLIAVDESAPAPGASVPPRTVAQPSEAPEGVNMAMAGGQTTTQAGQYSFESDTVEGELLRPERGQGSGGDMADEEAAEMDGRYALAAPARAERAGCASCRTAPSRAADHANGLAAAMFALAVLVRLRRRR